MPIVYQSIYGQGELRTAGTTLTIALTNSAGSGGSTIILCVGFDNTSLTTPTISSISKPAGETANWTLIAACDARSATSGDSQRVEMWRIDTTPGVTWNTSLTVTFSASITAKAGSARTFTGVGAVRGAGSASSGNTSISTAGLSPSVTPAIGDLVVGFAAQENNVALTNDSDTVGGNWVSASLVTTGGGGAGTHITTNYGHKIPTAAGAQAFNPTTLTGDNALIIALFEPASTGPVSHPFSGTVVAASAASGDMKLSTPLGGTVVAQSAVNGQFGMLFPFAGTVVAQSAVQGDMIRSTPFAGTVAAASAVQGDMKLRAALAGTTPAVSAAQGSMGARLVFAGSTPAASAVDGTMRLLAALAGQVNAVSTVDGDMGSTTPGTQHPFSGTVVAVSTAFGAMVRTTPFAGTVPAVSAVSGDMAARRALAGTVAAASVVSGAMGLRASFAGTVTSQSAATAAMALRAVLDGDVSAISAAFGTMDVSLRGLVTALSGAFGTMGLRARLQGQANAVSTVFGQIGGHPFAGVVNAQSTVFGDMQVRRALAGTVTAQSAAVGDMRKLAPFQGLVTVQSAAVGTMAALRPFSGLVEAEAEVFGALVAQLGFAGVIEVLSDAFGYMEVGEPPEFVVIDVGGDGFAVVVKQDPFVVEPRLDGFRVRGSAP